jgi:hypothetical protein
MTRHRYVISLSIVGVVECARKDVRATIADALDRMAGTRARADLVVWLEPATADRLTVHHAKDCEVPE